MPPFGHWRSQNITRSPLLGPFQEAKVPDYDVVPIVGCNLTGLLAKIKPAIDATTYAGERSAKNYAFVDAVARKNVEMTVAGIRQDNSVLAELEAKGAVKMAGAMYN